MEIRKIYLIALSILLSLAIFFAFNLNPRKKEWILDKSHGTLSFRIIHDTVSEVEGGFKKFDAKIITESKDFTNAVATLTARVGSIYTENEKLDSELRGPNYFDAEKYPVLTFVSRSFVSVDKKNYKVVGEMTIHGITRIVELNAYCRMGTSIKHKQPVAGFRVTGVIKRLAFYIGTTVPLTTVGNDVTISANVEFVPKPLPADQANIELENDTLSPEEITWE